jgi:hypothetical protein
MIRNKTTSEFVKELKKRCLTIITKIAPAIFMPLPPITKLIKTLPEAREILLHAER